ncbi:hypothetical protein [Hymenobacter koreensis]|uniref:Uncharacterized protein n=1 Tax=Hymenobacter koreensis TaxID=1084523 RepID=A0ABP8JM89_9BACT
MKPPVISHLLLSLLLCAGCKKEKTPLETLPPATQTGQNRAGCLIDGQAWQPAYVSSTSSGNPFFVSWRRRPSGYALTLTMMRITNSQNMRLVFWVPNIRRAGTFALDQTADPRITSANPPYGQFIDYEPFPGRDYLTGPAAAGTLTITRFDTVARIVSGTFELTPQTDDGQTVRLTDGRFDVTF